ncbi:MAG: ribonuclease III [Candidatus Limnocylindria bacterium]
MDAPPLAELSARLGIDLREPELIRQAFVHTSFFNENPHLAAGHNERLEFYGDAVIGVAVSRLLFERYPDEDEGFLTARRAALVNREALAVMALSIGLDRYLLLGRGESDAGGAARPSVLAACFEALAGALSMSEGTERAERVLERLFAPHIEALATIAGPPKSAKSLLQEWSQRFRGVKPIYRLLETSGPPHEQQFRVAVVIDGSALGHGAGSSRQRAEEKAAGAAMAVLPELPDDAVQPSAS